MKTASYFSATFNGVKVYGAWTDPSRPTCGNILTEEFDFKLVTEDEMGNIQSWENVGEALRASK